MAAPAIAAATDDGRPNIVSILDDATGETTDRLTSEPATAQKMEAALFRILADDQSRK